MVENPISDNNALRFQQLISCDDDISNYGGDGGIPGIFRKKLFSGLLSRQGNAIMTKQVNCQIAKDAEEYQCMHATLSDTFFNVVNVVQQLQHNNILYNSIPGYRYWYIKTIPVPVFQNHSIHSVSFRLPRLLIVPMSRTKANTSLLTYSLSLPIEC
jgi:hypothetical protein